MKCLGPIKIGQKWCISHAMLVWINKRCDLSVKNAFFRSNIRFLIKISNVFDFFLVAVKFKCFVIPIRDDFWLGRFFKSIFPKSKFWNKMKTRNEKLHRKNHPGTSSKSNYYWKVMGNLSGIKPMQRRLMQVTFLLIGANHLLTVWYDLFGKSINDLRGKWSNLGQPYPIVKILNK